MLTEEVLLEKAKKLVEDGSGWGDSKDWTNSDFMALSEKIKEDTGVSLSHVTLKRLWGKVKYDSLPNTHTLDTLVQFTGYENWRQFKLQNGNGNIPAAVEVAAVPPPSTTSPAAIEAQPATSPVKPPVKFLRRWLIAAAVVVLPCIYFFIPAKKVNINPADYKFTSKKVITSGLPNSVIFDYDATKAPYDSVIIQQSWDVTRQVTVSKDDHQHTSIYYFPDYYQAKLIVGNRIVQRHNLLIKSDGWLSLIMRPETPVYLDTQHVKLNGTLTVTPDMVTAHNIPMQPDPPTIWITNVKDLGELYSDNFVFETAVKNDYKNGAAACQVTRIYLLCENKAIWVPLSAKGCISSLDLRFTDFVVSGKQTDLSNFGVDFSQFAKLRIECKGGKAQLFVNGQLAYTVDKQISHTKIIGFGYSFNGSGTIDYVRLNNGKVSFDDEF